LLPMFRTMFSVALVSSLFACATDDTSTIDNLQGESDRDGEASKADGGGAFTFVKVSPAVCIPEQECNGFSVERLNRSTIQCGRASVANCMIDKIDWSRTAMPKGLAENYEQDLRNGRDLILRAEVIPAP